MQVSFYVQRIAPVVIDFKWDPNYQDSDITLLDDDYYAYLATNAGSFHSVLATDGKSSGKWFVELEAGSIGNSCQIGLTNSLSVNLETYCGLGNDSWGCASTNGDIYHDGGNTDYMSPGWDAGDTPIGLAVDVDAGKFWLSKDGVWTGDPVAGTGEARDDLTGTLWLMISFYAVGQNLTIKTLTKHAAPSGYSYWGGATLTPYFDEYLFGSIRCGACGFTPTYGPIQNNTSYTFDGIEEGLYKAVNDQDESDLNIYAKFLIHDKNQGIQTIWKSGGYSNGIAIGIDTNGDLGVFGRASDALTKIVLSNASYDNDVWYELWASQSRLVIRKPDGTGWDISGSITPAAGTAQESVGFAYSSSPLSGDSGTREWFDGEVSEVRLCDDGDIPFPSIS